TASFLTFEDLIVGDQGSFEVFLSPQRRPGNWLENPNDGTKLFVRQVYSDWSNEPPGEVHIDRVGSEGSLRPPLTENLMARRLARHPAARPLAGVARVRQPPDQPDGGPGAAERRRLVLLRHLVARPRGCQLARHGRAPAGRHPAAARRNGRGEL